MKSIFEIMSYGVIKHRKGRILKVNKKGASILGYSPDELANTHFLSFLNMSARKKIQEMIRSGRQKKYYISARKKNGRSVDLIVYPDAASVPENGVRIGMFRKA